jgi:hypothetical protein
MKVSNKFRDQIKKDYDGLFDHIETRISKITDDLNKANGGSTTIASTNVNVPSATSSSIDAVNQIYQLLDQSFGNDFRKELFKRLDDGVAVGGEGSGKRKKQDYSGNKKEDEERSAGYQAITSWMVIDAKFNDLIDLTNRSFVQSKELNKMIDTGLKTFDNLRDVVKAFRDQEGIADSIVSLIMGLLESLFGFMVDAASDNYNTLQETWTNYMLYAQQWGDRNIGYLKTQDEYVKLLATKGLDDNIRNTTLMKKYVELASKGLSKSAAYEASMQSAIYDVIAPNLDQTSSIFLDFQTRGMTEITNSLSGMVESVRSTAGSSRIAMNSLSTIIDKLGPVELYAQKGLLGDDAARLLSFLETQGMSTQDAMAIVDDIVTAYSNPFQALTGGSVIQTLLAQQVTSGGADSLTDLYNWYADYFNAIQNPKDSATYRGAKLSAYNINMSSYNDQELALMDDTYQLTKTTSEAYDQLVEKLANGDLQTASEMANITITNSEIGMGVATLIADLEDWLKPIWQDVSDLADYFVGSSRRYKQAEEQANAIGDYDWLTEEAEQAGKNLRNEAIKDTLFVAPWTMIGRVLDVYTADDVTTTDLYRNANNIAKGQKMYKAKSDYERRYPYYEENSLEEFYGKDPGYGKAARGAYLTQATPLIAGEAGPEFVIPEQKLVDTIGTGLEQYLLKTNLDPDYTTIVNAIYTATSELVKAIAENGGNVTVNLDNKTGLMNMNTSNSSTSLKPIMGR